MSNILGRKAIHAWLRSAAAMDAAACFHSIDGLMTESYMVCLKDC